LFIALSLLVLAAVSYSVRARAESSDVAPAKATQINEVRVQALLDEMRRADLDTLAAIEIKPLVLPEPGVHVMRVRLEETYDIAGIGKDTIELKGWIAVKHDHTRPGEDERVLTWNSAITDTEFVGMELHGKSPVFGAVEITLDATQPSVGQVGKLNLSFAEASILDVVYRPYRTLLQIDQEAANRIQGPTIALAQSTPAKPASTLASGAAARPVIQVLDGVLKAISAKDAKAMARFYSPAGNNLFFGPADKGVTRGSESYINGLARSFKDLKTFEAKRNDDVQVRLSGNLAVATLTGTNTVVDAKGERGTASWRWTVELERSGNKWLITHDHLSFGGGGPQELGVGKAAGAAACRAEVAVSIKMNDLDLTMRTATPVEWYSEVETIPPVGATASVSVHPTQLLANGRSVGTLQSGAVKFREVVRHVPLIDVTQPVLRIASEQ
jgi:ketosteroid isomerase-like protein